MKIYIVISSEIYDNIPEKVFDSRQKAEKYIYENINPYTRNLSKHTPQQIFARCITEMEIE